MASDCGCGPKRPGARCDCPPPAPQGLIRPAGGAQAREQAGTGSAAEQGRQRAEQIREQAVGLAGAAGSRAATGGPLDPRARGVPVSAVTGRSPQGSPQPGGVSGVARGPAGSVPSGTGEAPPGVSAATATAATGAIAVKRALGTGGQASPPSGLPPRSGQTVPQPGGAVNVGIRTPFGAVGGPLSAGTSDDLLFRATGYRREWGTPPESEGFRWNHERYVYEPVPLRPSANLGAAVLHQENISRAREGIYYQVQRTGSDPARPWVGRWVRVRTSLPSLQAPYEYVGPADFFARGASRPPPTLSWQAGTMKGMEGQVGSAVSRQPIESPLPRLLGNNPAQEQRVRREAVEQQMGGPIRTLPEPSTAYKGDALRAYALPGRPGPAGPPVTTVAEATRPPDRASRPGPAARSVEPTAGVAVAKAAQSSARAVATPVPGTPGRVLTAAGSVPAGLRIPEGRILRSGSRPRSPAYPVTGFDRLNWGTPPAIPSGTWDPSLEVYQPAIAVAVWQAHFDRYDEILALHEERKRRARRREFVQPVQDDEAVPGVWTYRWVRVPADPGFGRPYVDVGPADLSWELDLAQQPAYTAAAFPFNLDEIPLDALGWQVEDPNSTWLDKATGRGLRQVRPRPPSGPPSPSRVYGDQARVGEPGVQAEPIPLGAKVVPPGTGSEDETALGPTRDAGQPGLGGSVLAGMRTPAGAVLTPLAHPRSPAYGVTGFDRANWGTPPAIPSGSWDPTLAVYQPAMPVSIWQGRPDRYDVAQSIYAERLRRARLREFIQPVQDDLTEPGVWRYRWVRVPDKPDFGNAYRDLGAADLASELDLAAEPLPPFMSGVGAGRQSTASGTTGAAGGMKGMPASLDQILSETPASSAAEFPESLPATTTQTIPVASRSGDFYWIRKGDLPAGCPYPYPFMPVPVQDYEAGMWLEAGYVPSIPLPPPHGSVSWQCGIEALGPQKPKDKTKRAPETQKAPPSLASQWSDLPMPNGWPDQRLYFWVDQRELPAGCPYPYTVMPVPIGDYRSGQWLSADYIPAYKLPPGYADVPWQCSSPPLEGIKHKGGGGTPSSAPPDQPLDTRPDPNDLDAKSLDNLMASEKQLEQWRKEMKDRHSRRLITKELVATRAAIQRRIQERRNRLNRLQNESTADIAALENGELATQQAQLKGMLEDPGLSANQRHRLQQTLTGVDNELRRRGIDPALVSAARRARVLQSQRAVLVELLKTVGANSLEDRADAQVDLQSVETELRALRAAFPEIAGEDEERVVVDAEGYAWRRPEPPVFVPIDASPEDPPPGDPGQPPRPERLSRGIRISCDLPKQDPTPRGYRPLTGFAPATGMSPEDCRTAIEVFLRMLNTDLHTSLGAEWQNLYFDEVDGMLRLFDRKWPHGTLADPVFDPSKSEWDVPPNLAALAVAVNGLSPGDSRTEDMNLVIVNNNWQYQNGVLGGSTGMDATAFFSYPGTGADVVLNIESQRQLRSALEGIGLIQSPFNLVAALTHEVAEHIALSRIPPGPRRKDEANDRAIEAEVRLSREMDWPRRVSGEVGFVPRTTSIDPVRSRAGFELPVEFYWKGELGMGTRRQRHVRIRFDHRGGVVGAEEVRAVEYPTRADFAR